MKNLNLKSALTIEYKKEKRSGAFEILIVASLVGSAYAIANFIWRKNALLSLPLAPMDILLTQLYGMIALLNLFAMIIASILIYHLEFQNRGLEKMRTLSFSLGQMFECKFLILSFALFISLTLESLTLLIIGLWNFSNHFVFSTWLWFSLYCFITSLPALSFMLLGASFFENLWVSLGLGVAGFLSGMALSSFQDPLFLLDPFILFLKPALELQAKPSLSITFLAIFETTFFVLLGIFSSQRRKV